LDGFDPQAAHAALDRHFATTSVETTIAEVLVPYLQELGDRWERGDASIAQEHFASNLLRGRLLALARDWAIGPGPTYVLACPPNEEHDLGLVMFGIAVARRGARVIFLGADTPVATIADAIRETRPDGVVVAVSRREALDAVSSEVASLADDVPLYVCGSGAVAADVMAMGGVMLEGDPVTAARTIQAGDSLAR
jgi:methanogenic corrinoid protein MtbC1